MTVPSSLTDIANLSLTSIGESPIENINTDTDTTAQVLRRWMDVIIEEIQQDIHWNELYTGPVSLAVVQEDFVVPGQFKYLLPADFIQLYEVGVDTDDLETPGVDSRNFNNPWWHLEDGFIISRIGNVNLLYGRKDKTVANWSIQMREVIYTAIAEKLAYEITSDSQLQDKWTKKLELTKARAYSSRQNKGRSFRTRPQFFNMASARRNNYSAINYNR